MGQKIQDYRCFAECIRLHFWYLGEFVFFDRLNVIDTLTKLHCRLGQYSSQIDHRPDIYPFFI
jgi:hypothetical protein